MKTFRFLLAALIAATSVPSAMAQPRHNDYQPVVYLIGTQKVTASDPDCDTPCSRHQLAVDRAILDFLETQRSGFQQPMLPQMIFSSRTNKVSFAIGGNVNMRVGYDFKGIVNNKDFVTYDIPVPGNYNTRQKLMMDASTSRIFFKAIANTSALGRVVAMIETDFRGSSNYAPRIRLAYVSFLGFTLGRDVTTFCDLNSSPTTIDFEGPNAYNFNFNTMIRYSRHFGRHFSMGVAAEMPEVSATYGETFASLHQRVPDFPMYVQYTWGHRQNSHIRVTGVLRDMYYRNLTLNENRSELGWGVQLSGHIAIGDRWNTFFNGVYGEGITPYLQDITGAGLDLVVNQIDPTKIKTLPMYGWFAAGQFNITPWLFVSGGYSTVVVEKKDGYYTPNQYKEAQYIFGNCFCHITPRFQVAMEYLHGTRTNMSGEKNSANRIQAMVQYNF